METLVGWMRFKDRMKCPVGALACYVVYAIDILGIKLLNFMLQVS